MIIYSPDMPYTNKINIFLYDEKAHDNSGANIKKIGPENLYHICSTEKDLLITQNNNRKLTGGEKELDKFSKSIVSIYDNNHDPFLFYVATSGEFTLKINPKSDSLKYKDYSIKTIQKNRNSLLKDYPHRITLHLNYFEYELSLQALESMAYNRYKAIAKPIIKYNKNDPRRSNAWQSIVNTSFVDFCFKTEAGLNTFVDYFLIGKIFLRNLNEYKIDTAVRKTLYGKSLARYFKNWSEIHIANGYRLYTDFDWMGIGYDDPKYVEELKKIHDWCKANLDGKFVMMEFYREEKWFFEKEEDLNYFLLKWKKF